jgi:hypothetical protein
MLDRENAVTEICMAPKNTLCGAAPRRRRPALPSGIARAVACCAPDSRY